MRMTATHHLAKSISLFVCFILLTACSTTRNLLPDETLYTGLESVLFVDSVVPPEEVELEVLAALEYAPNNALFGSAYYRSPIPFGLWTYNALVNKKSKFSRWLFETFAKEPIYLSTVNPLLRTKVVSNLLRENGYFDASASYELVPHRTNTKKSKVRYAITLHSPYIIDSIQTKLSPPVPNDTLVERHLQETLISRGKRFSVSLLEAERKKFSDRLRENGYFFFNPGLVSFKVDTAIDESIHASTTTPFSVWMQTKIKPNIPPQSLRPWHIGNVQIRILGYENELPTDTLFFKDKLIAYEGKLRVKPELLYQQIAFRGGDLYKQSKHEQTIADMARTGIFRYAGIQYVPRDSSERCDTIDMQITARYNLPLSSELELNFSAKSNSKIGPNTAFGVTKNNLFGRGETFKVKGRAAYEWHFGERTDKGEGGSANNYEFGLSTTLAFPRNVLWKSPRKYNEVKTSFELNANILNLSDYFKMLSAGGGVTVDFRQSKFSTHTITPFRIRYNLLYDETDKYLEKIFESPGLLTRFQDELIPTIEYTYEYSNDHNSTRRHRMRWNVSVSEAGNILNSLYAIAGNDFGEKSKKLCGTPFSQYVKLASEFRYNRYLSDGHNLVGRIRGGIIHNYGNGSFSPYNEQFYVGGANSIRAFSMRTIGPGRFVPDNDEFDYLFQTGDFLLEANLEYRFRLFDQLSAALFVDAGNVWMLKKNAEQYKSAGVLTWKHFLNDIALGTGAGIRYDLDFFILRVDVGIGLHIPYDTGKQGYYNIPTFKDGIAFHLASGYPF